MRVVTGAALSYHYTGTLGSGRVQPRLGRTTAASESVGPPSRRLTGTEAAAVPVGREVGEEHGVEMEGVGTAVAAAVEEAVGSLSVNAAVMTPLRPLHPRHLTL